MAFSLLYKVFWYLKHPSRMPVIIEMTRRRHPREELRRPVVFCSDFTDSQNSRVNRCWEHVLFRERMLRNNDGDDSATLQAYNDAVTRVEEQAIAIYQNDEEEQHYFLGSAEFVQIMIQQGCFILQVALYCLGGPEPLGYRPNYPILDPSEIGELLDNMFSVTKQFPLVVLQELLKQNYFKKVLKSRKWKRPIDLRRMVIYDFLVEPMLDGLGSHLSKRFFSLVNRKAISPPPTLLHALWLSLTGPFSGNANINIEEEDDSISAWSTIRSATELQKLGVTFKSNEGRGIRGIRFKKQMLDAVLYLPSIFIEPTSRDLFKHLIDYERGFESCSSETFPALINDAFGLSVKRVFKRNQQNQQVCAHLKLLREIIRTSDDAKILAIHGIIYADPRQEEGLANMLRDLPLPEGGNSNHLRLVRHQIRSYTKPVKWEKLRNLIYFTLFLTLMQTIYTVLSFHLK